MNNRKRRKRKNIGNNKKQWMYFNFIIGIMCLAVITGYAATKYVIYPFFINMNQENVVEQEITDSGNTDTTNKILEDGLNVITQPAISKVNTEPDKAVVPNIPQDLKGYSVQFGSFTTKASAEELEKELKTYGIVSQILEKDGMFKVVGQLFDTKEAAKEAMVSIDRNIYSDVFVTKIN